MYADDMLILSNSQSGLERASYLLEAHCDKWQLVVNTSKTKVIIFNIRNNDHISFTYKGVELEITKQYT